MTNGPFPTFPEAPDLRSEVQRALAGYFWWFGESCDVPRRSRGRRFVPPSLRKLDLVHLEPDALTLPAPPSEPLPRPPPARLVLVPSRTSPRWP
eukprot:7383103-Prymnesium_polylepis.1